MVESTPPSSVEPPSEQREAPEERGRNKWTGAGATAVGLGLLAAKAKGILAIALNAKWLLIGGKALLSSFSLLASIWFYALFWGWAFAFVFVMLILVHELGHVIFMRALGIPASLPYFIPGMGAFVTMKGSPANALQEAFVALAGPLVGSFASLACYLFGALTGKPFWLAIAYTGFFLNLFNLFPVLPLDGGRIVGAISPRIWVAGLAALIVAAIAFRWWNPLLIVLVVLSIPRTIAALRGRLDEHYFGLSLGARTTVAASYFGLAALLFLGMLVSRVAVPGHGPG